MPSSDEPTRAGRRRPDAAAAAPRPPPSEETTAAAPRHRPADEPTKAAPPRRPPDREAGPTTVARGRPARRSVSTRSWGLTAGFVGASIAFGLLAVWLWGNGQLGWAVVAAVLAIPPTFAALFIRKAPCPACGAPTTLIGVDRCGACGRWLTMESGTIRRVEPGFVSDLPVFDVLIPLPLIPRLVWPDEGTCCVCGQRADVEERLEIQDQVVRIPHCTEHTQGVSWSLGMSGESNVANVTLAFRSFDAWSEFRARNQAHLKGGLWR